MLSSLLAMPWGRPCSTAVKPLDGQGLERWPGQGQSLGELNVGVSLCGSLIDVVWGLGSGLGGDEGEGVVVVRLQQGETWPSTGLRHQHLSEQRAAGRWPWAGET